MYTNDRNQSSRLSIIKGTTIFIAGILVSFLISRIFITSYTVSNSSMEKTLSIGDKIIILKITGPKTGDIILLKSPIEPGKVLLKRIIAVENSTIEIQNKKFYINNKKIGLKSNFKSIDKRIFPKNFTYRDNMPKIKLKKHEFFVIGDNIDNSFDSRTFGPVNKDHIIGKMIYKF